MKTTLFKLVAILLILTGWFYSCGNEDDIDMSNIDFSNIEDLYAQPLPIIQATVQGKWKVYQIATDGIWYNVSYPEDLYIDFKDNYHVWESEGKRDTTYFTWEKTIIEDWRNPLNGRLTYIMRKGNPAVERIDNWYFDHISNDTLDFGGRIAPVYFRVTKVK